LIRIEAFSLKNSEILKKIKQLRQTKEDDIKQIGGIFKTRNVLKYIANILLNTSGGQEMDAALTVSLKKRKPNDEVSVSSLARQQELSRKINFSIMGIDSLSRGH
ncbi:12837_t:CDS:2, partial [Gigaspora rosea]